MVNHMDYGDEPITNHAVLIQVTYMIMHIYIYIYICIYIYINNFIYKNIYDPWCLE